MCTWKSLCLSEISSKVSKVSKVSRVFTFETFGIFAEVRNRNSQKSQKIWADKGKIKIILADTILLLPCRNLLSFYQFGCLNSLDISIQETYIHYNDINTMDEAFISSTGIGLLACYWNNWESKYHYTNLIKKTYIEYLF